MQCAACRLISKDTGIQRQATAVSIAAPAPTIGPRHKVMIGKPYPAIWTRCLVPGALARAWGLAASRKLISTARTCGGGSTSRNASILRIAQMPNLYTGHGGGSREMTPPAALQTHAD